MTTVRMNGSHETLSQNDAKEMLKYGIRKVSIEYFYLGAYGYLDLKDAVAQARREQKAALKKS